MTTPCVTPEITAAHMLEARITANEKFAIVCRCGWNVEIPVKPSGAHLPAVRAKIAEHKAEIAKGPTP